MNFVNFISTNIKRTSLSFKLKTLVVTILPQNWHRNSTFRKKNFSNINGKYKYLRNIILKDQLDN